MAQGSQFPLKKPPGFHYDFFILGITTFVAGLLGVPAPNGLIPQAPIHTTSLLIMQGSHKNDIEDRPPPLEKRQSTIGSMRSRLSQTRVPRFREELEPDPTHARDGEGDARHHEIPVAVVEQRVSNLAQGALCLVLLSGPFLHVLNLIPRGVLAGLLYVLQEPTIKRRNLMNSIAAGTWGPTPLKAMELQRNYCISSGTKR